jgi:hypothetical protein
MLDAVLPWLTKQAGKVFAGETPEPMGTRDPVLAPYQQFETADGYLTVAALNQKLWRALCVTLDREDLLDRLEGVPREGRIPHLASLLAGPDGELWVRRYRPDVDAQWLGGQRSRPGGDWWVVDGEGEIRGRVRVPDDLELLDVAEDGVLAVARDALGVDRVVVHGLVR